MKKRRASPIYITPIEPPFCQRAAAAPALVIILLSTAAICCCPLSFVVCRAPYHFPSHFNHTRFLLDMLLLHIGFV